MDEVDIMNFVDSGSAGTSGRVHQLKLMASGVLVEPGADGGGLGGLGVGEVQGP
jgi:hypothetical protein